jgi:uncharacterized membrane protein YqjE
VSTQHQAAEQQVRPAPGGPAGREARSTDSASASTAELLKDLSRQLTTLIHQEVELAKSEMGTKASRAAKGAGALAGGVVVALFGLGALVTAAIVGLDHAVSLWLSALIVGAALLVVAGVVALIGKATVSKGVPPLPTEAAESTKEDVEWLKTHARSAKP